MQNPKQVKIDLTSLRHDPELDELISPIRPAGVEFARKAEREIFSYMLEWKTFKIYVWDDFVSDGNNARWDWCFATVKPEGKACCEMNSANLIAMDDWQFELLVKHLPKSPNEDIVREWRTTLRKDPLIVRWAEAEAPYTEWRDLEYDPDLLKRKLL